MSSLGYIKQEALNLLKSQNFKNAKHAEVLEALKVKGIYVLPNYLPANTCAELRNEIDRLLLKYEGQLWTDSLGSDRRVFGANQVSKGFEAYFKDAFIREVLTTFESRYVVNGFTMAARLDFKTGNLGSGNGWHRDSAHYSQTKSIVYLSSTTMENGPFEYITGSHTPRAFVTGWMKKLYHLNQYRYSEEEIAKYKEACPDQKLEVYPAGEGTLILADTRGLHRGRPIEKGTRYAATNYFFMDREPPAHLIAQIVK